MNKPVVPDSRLRESRNVQFYHGANWVPIFCANCGGDGGFVPEENMNFAFYLCQPCADRLPPIEGTYQMPDEEFHQKVAEAQIEKYGRLLSPIEVATELEDLSSILSKLKKENK